MPNLLLDFTNRQVRRFYGISDYSQGKQDLILSEWLNVAVWACDEFCLIPVGFVLEDPVLVRLLNLKKEYLSAGLVQWPMRSAGLDRYVTRRREEYSNYREDYRALYEDEAALFVESFSIALKDRSRRSGETLADLWSSGVSGSQSGL